MPAIDSMRTTGPLGSSGQCEPQSTTCHFKASALPNHCLDNQCLHLPRLCCATAFELCRLVRSERHETILFHCASLAICSLLPSSAESACWQCAPFCVPQR